MCVHVHVCACVCVHVCVCVCADPVHGTNPETGQGADLWRVKEI